MKLRIYMKHGKSLLLVEDDIEISEANAEKIVAYKYQENTGKVSAPLKLLNWLRFDPYWEDPDIKDEKRVFYMTDDYVSEKGSENGL